MSRFGSRLRGTTPVGQWLSGGSLAIESVQYGTVALAAASSGTATITAVDTSRSVLIKLGQSGGGINAQTTYTRLELTNSTTVTATLGAAGTVTTSFMVVQLKPGVARRVQYFSITIADPATSATATVTAVDVNKSFLIHNGNSFALAGTQSAQLYNQRVTLTNSTTVTGTRTSAGGAGDDCIAACCLVELI